MHRHHYEEGSVVSNVQWERKVFSVNAYRSTSFRCMVLLPPQSGIAKEGEA